MQKDGLLQLLQLNGFAYSPEEVLAKLKLLSQSAASEPAAPPPPVDPAVPEAASAAAGAAESGEQAEGPLCGARSVESHRGPTTISAMRKKPKDIPGVSLDQKAAAARAATGSARQERLRAARASGAADSSEEEEDAASRIRIEEELDQQSMP